MKKIINLKEVLVVLLSVVLITISANVFATEGLFVDEDLQQNTQGNEYDGAQVITGNSYLNTNSENDVNNTNNTNVNNTNTNKNTSVNTVKTYNTNNSNNLPQTGIEDYNIGILLIVCIASAIFAYNKINEYRNV